MEETTSGAEGFEFLDIDYNDVAEAEKEIGKGDGGRDKRICVCGHPVGRHSNASGIVYCKPSRMECPCKDIRPVIRVADVRSFLRKTEGSGALHALGRGLKAAVDAKQKVEWLIEQRCDRCKEPGKVGPVAVTQRGVIVQSATGFDALLCAKCRQSA